MRKTIYDKFDKTLIESLPIVKYPGRIYVVTSGYEAGRAVEFLLKQDILGMDTETRPSFSRGATHKVALLQVATREECFLFRLNRLQSDGLPPCILRLLSNTKVPMLGLSWHDDLTALHRRAPFEPGFFIDVQDKAGLIGMQDRSLQKIYANLFGQRISKRQRLTNWEADSLTEKQQEYAAIDAWAVINIYEEIMRLYQTKDYDYVQTVNTEESQAGEP